MITSEYFHPVFKLVYGSIRHHTLANRFASVHVCRQLVYGLAIHLRSSSSPVQSCCLACQRLALLEEHECRAYAGWGRCRPLFRAASRRGSNRIPEGDGGNRKRDYGGGCRDLERERYGCGWSNHSGRGDRLAHSSHEKVWRDVRGYLRTMWTCCCVVAAPVHFSDPVTTTFCYCLQSCTSNLCSVCLCFPFTFRGKPCTAGRSCFDCLFSKLSSLSSHGFIHKPSSKPKALSVLRQLSVYSNRGEKGEFFVIFICQYSVPFRRECDKTCKTHLDFDLTSPHCEWVSEWVGN